MHGGIGWVDAHGPLQRIARGFVFALCNVERRQVVVGFRKFRVVQREPGKYLNRLLRAFLLGQDQAAQKARLGHVASPAILG